MTARRAPFPLHAVPVPTFPRRRALALLAGAFFFARALTAAAIPAPDLSAGLEEGLPLVERILPEDYRGLGEVPSVAVMPGGVIAFGSSASIYLYDRAGFTRVPVPTTYVTAMLCDADGRLWVGGDAVVGVIEPDPATGAPQFVSQLERLPAGSRDVGSLRALARGDDGTIYAASVRGLARFPRAGAARWWPLPADNFPRIAASGGRLLHASTASGLSILEGDTVRNIVAPGTMPGRVGSVLAGAPGHVRVLTVGQGLLDCDLATARVTPFPTPLDAFLRAHPAVLALPLEDGRWALTLLEGGLLLVESDWTRARIFTTAHGLSSNRINSIRADQEGGVWLATTNGLTRVQLAPGVSTFDERSGFSAAGVTGLTRQDGVFYAGSREHLLRLVPSDPVAGTPARFVPDPRYDGLVFGVLGHPAGLLLATSGGVTLLPRTGGAQVVVKTSDVVLAVIASQRDPALVFALTQQGIYVLRYTANGFATSGPLRADISFWTAVENPDGSLWCGTRASGLVRVTPPVDGDWSQATVTAFPLGAAGLPVSNGWTGTYAAFGETQFLADDGTHRWDAASQSFPLDVRITLDERHDVRTFPVVTDRQGRVWTSPWHGVTACSRPLGWFDPARVWHDAPPVAAAAVGFFGAGYMRIESGSTDILWAKGSSGLVRLDLAALRSPSPPADWRPALRSVRADGQMRPLTAATAPAFPFSREPIVFHFSAPRHSPGAGVRYRTRLLGFDAAWSAPQADPEREFTNLSGGPFTFEVQALDAAGHESPVTSYVFSVTPPWHRRPAAFALYVLLALAGVAAFVRWRLHRATRERERLERLVATRTSELAIARDAAESASRAKSAFLASMSHELRTPLNGVLGYAQLLQADRRLAPDQQERLGIVRQSGEHLLHMINDVLDLAKIEAGKLTLRPAPFALGDLLRDIAAAHAHIAAGKGLAFTTETAPDLPAWVEADAQKLRQILDNLIGNAIKFTAQGRVTLRVQPAPRGNEGLIEFAVTDTGPGIALADQPRLFQAFEQAATSHADATGTGLGLAISRALVERCGGTLTLDSAPGRGSTFAFMLPLPAVQPGVAATAAGHRIVGFTGGPRRALIVDDHPTNRQLLCDLLRPLGFDCTDHASAATALDLLARGAEPWPDLAVLDLRMPEMDGLELTRRLRALPRGPELKVLLTSASVIGFDSATALQAGCDDFLPKPFRTADLLEKLSRLLGLTWRESDSAPPFAPDPVPVSAVAGPPLNESARVALRESLATGDLEAFTAELARQRAAHPGDRVRFDELAAAAAGFQLSRLRQLLD